MSHRIRAATLRDHDALYALSEHLDSVNLPHDEAEIRALLQLSEDSFSGAIDEPRRRTYVFVLEELATGRALGTSMVIGQLGSRDAPYIFFDVNREEWYSDSLDKHFVHRVLSIGYSYHGPTEIGGLVVHPDERRSPARLGMLISYVRFLFIAAHREWFQNRVLAELMPPLEPDGTSHLWEAVGRKFTGLSYREADRLSKKNKEFIRNLFPRGDIYASLLPQDAQDVVGEVGRDTKGVAKMLTRIGFRYWDRVDPFDGGPHYIAATDEIELVQRSRPWIIESKDLTGQPVRRHLVARVSSQAPFFEAVPALAQPVCTESPALDPVMEVDSQALDTLGHLPGESLWVLPLY